MRILKAALKRTAWAIAIVLTFPCAMLSAMGRFDPGFAFFAQGLALVPGLPGSYLRVAYYFMTLQSCSLESHISMGTFFSRSQASVGKHVYIGSYCVLGNTSIGDHTQIAGGVQVLSGRYQHLRDAEGRISGAEEGIFQLISIGENCWIGAGSIVMATVGEGTTIGAGSIVVRPIPAHSIAFGNPARPREKASS